MKVLWTPTARVTYLEILGYLLESWSEKDVLKFNSKVEKTIERIQKNPGLFVALNKNQNIRKGFVVKQISLVYKVLSEKNEIHLITFWDNRRNPNDLKF